MQSGLVLLALGNYTEAQGVLQSALEVDPQHVPALFAAAQLLLAFAKYRIAQGTPGQLCTVAVMLLPAAALATAAVPVCPDQPAHAHCKVDRVSVLFESMFMKLLLVVTIATPYLKELLCTSHFVPIEQFPRCVIHIPEHFGLSAGVCILPLRHEVLTHMCSLLLFHPVNRVPSGASPGEGGGGGGFFFR